MIQIDLHGEPIPLKRPRFARQGKYVRVYDSQSTLKENYRWQIKSQHRADPFGCPLSVEVIFYMPIPKTTSKRKKRQMLNGLCHHIVRPDVDNLQKFLLDCLNEIVFYDDSQVIEIKCKKVYSEKPGTLVRIFPVEQIQTGEEPNAGDSRLSRR